MKDLYIAIVLLLLVVSSCQEEDSGPVGDVNEQLVGTWTSSRHVLSACEGTADYEITTSAIEFVFKENGDFEEYKVSDVTRLKVANGKFSTEDFNLNILEVDQLIDDVNLFGQRGTYAYAINEEELEIGFGDINTEAISCEGVVFFDMVE